MEKPRDTALRDILENLNWIVDAKSAEQDQIEYLLTSDSIRQWLNAKRLYILSIDAETSPEGTCSPISYATAMLAQALLESKTYPVLTYFCSIRCWQPDTKQKTAAVSFLRSLADQLLEEAGEKVPGFDPSSCFRSRTRRDAFASVDAALSLLEDLFRALPPKSGVFILVDSVSRLEMKAKTKARGKKAIEGLLAVAGRADVPVKLVVTDLLHAKIPTLLENAIEPLYLPDQVDVGGYGFHVEMALDETRLAIDQSFKGSDREDA